MYERMAIDATSVNETLSHLVERNDAQIQELSEQVQLVHERVSIDTRELRDRIADAGAGSGSTDALGFVSCTPR